MHKVQQELSKKIRCPLFQIQLLIIENFLSSFNDQDFLDGNQNLFLIAIQQLRFLGWWPKPIFSCHPTIKIFRMTIKTHFQSPIGGRPKPFFSTSDSYFQLLGTTFSITIQMVTKMGFRCHTNGDWKWVSITIQKILIVGWRPKIGFNCHLETLIVGWWLKSFGRQQLNLEKGACNILLKSFHWTLLVTIISNQKFNHQQLKIVIINDEKLFRLLYYWW